MEEKFRGEEHIKSGLKVAKDLIKFINKPVDKEALGKLKESVATISKQAKMLEKDEALRAQYTDRIMLDIDSTIIQAYMLALYSVKETDTKAFDYLYYEAVAWIRSHENIYEIGKRMQEAALKRSDFQRKMSN